MSGIIKMVKNGDVELATVSTGYPELGTMVLIMGATASMVWWPDSLIQRLAEAGYQVIRFDHRDTGRSSTFKPGEPSYDLADLAGDVLAVLDNYGVEAAHLVGMSLGAYLAQIE